MNGNVLALIAIGLLFLIGVVGLSIVYAMKVRTDRAIEQLDSKYRQSQKGRKK